jgi:hypothetical protein
LVFEKGFKNDFNQDFPFVCKQADLLNELTSLKSVLLLIKDYREEKEKKR